ncbi:hypothetical protein HON01_00150 [Candidatus Woesearchaeota archaeon]|nr:hypothetical protein [Candidatus Woesearchaeota archaeon]
MAEEDTPKFGKPIKNLHPLIRQITPPEILELGEFDYGARSRNSNVQIKTFPMKHFITTQKKTLEQRLEEFENIKQNKLSNYSDIHANELVLGLHYQGKKQEARELINILLDQNKLTKKTIFQICQEYNIEKKYEEIRNILEKVITKQGSDPDLYSQLIFINGAIGDVKKFKKSVIKWCFSGGMYLPTIHNIADNLRRIKKEGFAITLLNMFRKMGIYDKDSIIKISSMYMETNQYKKAIKVCKKTVDKCEDNKEIIRNLSYSYLHIGKNKKAIKCIAKNISKDELNNELYYISGYAYKNLEDFEKCSQFLEEGFHNSKLKPPSIQLLMESYKIQNKIDDAIKIGELAIKKGIADDRLLTVLIKNYNSIGAHDKSKPLVDQLIKKPKTNQLQILQLAQACRDIYNNSTKKNCSCCGKNKGEDHKYINYSLDLYNDLIEMDAIAADVYEEIIEIYKQQDKLEGISRVLKSAFKKNRTNANLHLYLANLEITKKKYITKNKFEEIDLSKLFKDTTVLKNTINTIKDKISTGEETSLNYYMLSRSYYALGDEESRLKTLQTAVKKKKANSQILLDLANITGEEKWWKKIMQITEDTTNHKDYFSYLILSGTIELIPDKIRQNLKLKPPQKYYKLMINQMKKNDDFDNRLINYIKATSSIKKIKPTHGFLESEKFKFEDSLIIKERDITNINPKLIEKEKIIRDKLEEIIEKKVRIPIYLDHFIEGNKAYYIMNMETGKTLTKGIKEGIVTEDHYEKILQILAEIHVLFPIEMLEDYNLENKLEERISHKNIEPEFRESCDPVIKVLQNSKHICYNKDSTTENWLITQDGQIKLIDTEDKGIVPYTVDLASFLNLDVSLLNFSEKIYKMRDYINKVNEVCENYNVPGKKITNKRAFEIEYHNAVVYRSITNSSSLSFRGNTECAREIRKFGIKTIEYMKKQNITPEKDIHHYDNIRTQLQEWIDNSEQNKFENKMWNKIKDSPLIKNAVKKRKEQIDNQSKE